MPQELNVNLHVDSKLGRKIVSALQSAIMGAYHGIIDPIQMRRLARSKADAERILRLSLAQTVVDESAILEGKKEFIDGQLVEVGATDTPSSSHDVVLKPEASKNALTLENAITIGRAARRSQNILAATALALEIAEDVPDREVADESVDPDWFAKWLGGVEDVSDEKIQTVWARLLAGEVQKPGSFSYQTIEMLKRLSKKEAELIARLKPFLINTRGILRTDEGHHALSETGLTYEKLMTLRDLGLFADLITGEGPGFASTIKNQSDALNFPFRCGDLVLFGVPTGEGDFTINLPISALSQGGFDLMKLVVSDEPAPTACIAAVAKYLRRNGITVKIGDVVRDSTTNVEVVRNLREFG